jgi:hypothetical protein
VRCDDIKPAGYYDCNAFLAVTDEAAAAYDTCVHSDHESCAAALDCLVTASLGVCT